MSDAEDEAFTWRERAEHWRGERDAAETKLAAVRALHPRDGGSCYLCGWMWPCPTIRALDGETPQDS